VSEPAENEPVSLEPPTGRRGVRAPTLYVLGSLIVVALAAIVRTCGAGA
jgi:hypothetical protein